MSDSNALRVDDRQEQDLPPTELGATARNETRGQIIARECAALAVALIGLMTLFSLISYHPNDASLNTAQLDGRMAQTHNWIGPVGAVWSDLCLQIMGLTAWPIAALLMFMGARTLLRRRLVPRAFEGTGIVLLALAAGTLVELLAMGNRHPYPLGGVLGAVLARVLRQHLAPMGAALVAATLGLAALSISLKGVLSRLFARAVSAPQASHWRRPLGALRKVPNFRPSPLGTGLKTALLRAAHQLRRQPAHSPLASHLTPHADLAPMPEAMGHTQQENQGPSEAQTWSNAQFGAAPEPNQKEPSFTGFVDETQASNAAVEPKFADAQGADVGPSILADSEPTFLMDAPIVQKSDDAKASHHDDTTTSQASETCAETMAERIADEMAQAHDTAPPDVAQAADDSPITNDALQAAVKPAVGHDEMAYQAMPQSAQAVPSHPEAQRLGPQVASHGAQSTPGPSPHVLPATALLATEAQEQAPLDVARLEENAERLTKTLRDYGIDGHVRDIQPGPVVTLYEYVPAPGIKLSKIASLADDLAMSMEALRVRIVAPIPGKGAVGIEIPNDTRETVAFKEIVQDQAFAGAESPLTLALGKDIGGLPMVADLSRMPHLLVAGATGAGKSVSLNAMIMSILFKASPEQVRMIMVDPKMLELSVYEGIPHLLLPVVTDPKKAALALRWAVEEMERRYELLSTVGVRNIDGYNARVEAGQKAGEPLTIAGADADMPRQVCAPLPYLLVIVDELADLMMVASREVESSIMRLAQMARAAGIHLIVATQRPSVDVLTGVIKANFPTRIAFQVASRHDSRTIIDANGAEHLLGRGDMLFLAGGPHGLQRVHGAYVSEEDIENTVNFVRGQSTPQYDESILQPRGDELADDDALADEDVDAMYDQALAVIAETQQASISMVQRRLRIGYNRAARMVERMEREGVVGPQDGAKPREVLVQSHNAN